MKHSFVINFPQILSLDSCLIFLSSEGHDNFNPLVWWLNVFKWGICVFASVDSRKAHDNRLPKNLPGQDQMQHNVYYALTTD